MPTIPYGQVQPLPIYILIDGSTKGTKKSHYGKSVACWGIYIGRLEGTPSNVGLIYRKHEGPNRVFYLGIVRALLDFFEMGYGGCAVEVKGDCQPVIDQLNGKWAAIELKSLYSRVKDLEQWYKSGGGTIKFSYIPRTDVLYKKIDRCAQQGVDFIEKRIQ